MGSIGAMGQQHGSSDRYFQDEKEIDKYYLERLNENYNNWINAQAFKIIRISTKDIN